ncbi:MAG: 1-deoxy-D-xylulose 5-phosphate reductoisomerase [Phycisphaerae bacterium]|nr:1-deoxy-D-xylulose 5-phosphate reductoisomerase [Phycisphaerae bacterium]
MPTTKRICILGSTGSIGSSALKVIAAMPGELAAWSLAARRDYKTLAGQVRAYAPSAVALHDAEAADRLRGELNGSPTRILSGPDALGELARDPQADLVVSAVVGSAGLPATMAAVRAGKTVALANKESLVVGGELLMKAAAEHGATLLPIDSEHSAVFQAIQAGRAGEVRRIILTASGGPFRTWDAARIAEATVEQALNHPTWNMGPKVTIDSATLMNKALEIIEAHHLFGVEVDRIEVLVHPESVIHSMVEFVDGSVIAQMGPTDMRSPIQYAMTWPRRSDTVCGQLDLTKIGRLTLEPPDHERFPALGLAYRAARAGGAAGAVLNGGNEAAVAAFLLGRIRFGQIVPLVARALREHESKTARGPLSLEQLQAADRWAQEQVNRWIA